MNPLTFYNEEHHTCAILNDFCDNVEGCMGCYHSHQAWIHDQLKKGTRVDSERETETYKEYMERHNQ